MIGRTTSAPRLSGKLGFVHVFMNGKFLQLSSNVELPTWETFKSLNQGDIIDFEGQEFVTKTGELTKRLLELQILRKCELGLPDKVAGVSTGVARQNPYLNLLGEVVSKDKATPYRDALILRHKILKEIRWYLDKRRYTEVTTPTLIENPFGCDAKPFETDGYFLRIAPELELKKLVVGGMERIYEIGKSFRNEGISQKHNPEFTMLEVYTVGGDFKDGAFLLTDLLKTVVFNIFGTYNVNGINWSDFQELPQGVMFPEEDLIQPTLVSNFTKEDSPLAKLDVNGIPERFELYVGGIELANGYSEQDDWRLQQEAFERQGVVDVDYIDALKRGLPPVYGIGLGIDRLIMLLTGRNIKEVL